MSRVLFAFLSSTLLFSVAIASTPTQSSPLACRRLMNGVSAFGHDCKTSADCTKLTCTLQNFLTYSIALEKCTRPVKVVLSVSIPSLGYSTSRTFEGEQRIKLPNVPSLLQFVIGQPYINVEAKRAPGGGISLSAGVWLKKQFGGWTRYSLFNKETIPVDTSTCATIESDVIPSQYLDYHDYDYDGSISDELKKALALFMGGKFGGGDDSSTSNPLTSFPHSPSSLDSLKEAIRHWLSNGGSSMRHCIDRSLQKIYGVSLNQLSQPGFKLDQANKLNRFNSAVAKCSNRNVPTILPTQSSLARICRAMQNAVSEKPRLPFENPDYDNGDDVYYQLMKECLKHFSGDNSGSKSNNHTDAIIIASSVSGAVVIAALVIIAVMCIRNKKRSQSRGQIVYGELNDEPEA